MRTIDTIETAKHIAKQNGLTLTYSRTKQEWRFMVGDVDVGRAGTRSNLENCGIDRFDELCTAAAVRSISDENMGKVVAYLKYEQAQNDNLGLSLDADDMAKLETLRLAASTNNKQVGAVIANVYAMLEEANEMYGSYWEHKQQVREAKEAGATLTIVDEFQPVDPSVTQALDAALIAQRRTVQPNTLEAATERKCMQHIQSFLHMISEGKSYDDAWKVITSRSAFGTSLLGELKARCVTAARSFEDSVREVGAGRMRNLGRKLVEITPEVSGKPSLHLSAATEDRLAFVVSNLTAEQAACLAEFVRNMKPA